MKPDTIDSPIYKPDTIDSPVYDKPNTYDEDNDSGYKEPIPQEVLDDLIVRAEFINGKRPAIKTNDEDEDQSQVITNSILSHIAPPTVSYSEETLTTTTPSPSNSSVCSDTSNATTSSSASRLALLQVLKKKPMEDMISFDLRKTSLTRPHEHDIYFKGTKKQAYRKVQPHSYSWGFQNVLYRTNLSQSNTQYVKVAEARRRAFQKEITIEWGDFPLAEEPLEKDDDEEATQTKGAVTSSHKMTNKTNSHLLFTYYTEFEGYRLRWKRSSLLSHDMTCELKQKEADRMTKWRVIAEFDSHRMGYFIHLGELIIDKNALSLGERPDIFEAHLIVTCCTLIDLMREVVEKAVGLGKGGVAGSD